LTAVRIGNDCNRVIGTLKFKSEARIELPHDIDQKSRHAAQQPWRYMTLLNGNYNLLCRQYKMYVI